jgi:NADH-quinone oxidoreductase subunit M
MLNLGTLIITPLIGILLNTLFVKNKNSAKAFNVGIVFALINMIISLIITYHFDFNNVTAIQFESQKFIIFNAFYLYNVGIDGLSLLMILLTNFLIILCLLSAKNSIKNKTAFFVNLFLLLQIFCIGLFVSKSIIWFYIFFEAILIPMFFVIGIWGGVNKIYASYKFFIYTLIGSLCFLLGLIYTVLSTGSTDILQIIEVLQSNPLEQNIEKLIWLAFFISLAIKVPMFPFHTWLPDAHVQAPTAGSVLLAGILIKIGGFGMIRFLLPMFPSASLYFSDFVIYLSIVAIIYGSIIAIMQEDIKKMIAYSSVAHMGFVTAAIFSLTQTGITASIFQMFSHGIVSGALFLCIGVLYERFHTREFKNFGGLAAKMPNFAILLMIFTMSSAGLPMTSGFVGEFMTIVAVYSKSIFYSFGVGLSVIFGAVYMLYMYKKTMFGKLNTQHSIINDLTKTEIISLSSLAIITIVSGIYPTIITKFVPIIL